MLDYEAVIGVEVHAELETQSKMFCACPVVDVTQAEPNSAICPVCTGMPGVLPVVNRRAVEYALRVALALECEIAPVSIFARKNYFYPDLPKGYQISQYEYPLARHGRMSILTSDGEQLIGIRRVHLEEDTGKLSHVSRDGQGYSLIDLNRAGVPLLEIVTEPDLHSAEAVRAYAMALRSLLRYLGVNSGDMQKGILRIEPNISIRRLGSQTFGTRVEIKNLNSFRVLERSVAYEIQRQTEALEKGQRIIQETLGWDEEREVTVTQRVKEQEDDYRYFPEPDLPPLTIEPVWIEQVRQSLPELPYAKYQRFQAQYGLGPYDAEVLTAEKEVADYFEQVSAEARQASPKIVANWITGELFGLLNQAGQDITSLRVSPPALAELIQLVVHGEINQNSAKLVLEEMFASGEPPAAIVTRRNLSQISDQAAIARLVSQVLKDNPAQVESYLGGKEPILKWLFGRVMQAARGRANPQVIQQELERQLAARKDE